MAVIVSLKLSASWVEWLLGRGHTQKIFVFLGIRITKKSAVTCKSFAHLQKFLGIRIHFC